MPWLPSAAAPSVRPWWGLLRRSLAARPPPPTRGAADSSAECAPLPPRPPPPPPPPRFNSPPAARSSGRLGGRNPAVVEGQWAGRGASQWQRGRGSAMQMKRVAGKPRQGAGPAEAAGSVLEVVGARRPTPAAEARWLPGGGFRVALASSFPLPSASREKHTYTTKTRRGDFPSLLCYFCSTVIGKTKRRRKSGCFTPCRPRPDHPTQPLEGQVLTKRCHSCQVYMSPCICFY